MPSKQANLTLAAQSDRPAVERSAYAALVLSEPYRLFFPFGWIACLIGVSYWIFVGTRLLNDYAPLFHGLIQIELFGGAFAIGFLLTALPKFLRTRSVSRFELGSIVLAYTALALALLCNSIKISQICFVVLITLVIIFAAVRVRSRKSDPPYSFLLVGFGLLQGLVGAILIIFPSAILPLLGPKLIEQGMLLSLSLGVGSFLGPRLMGVVDTTNALVNLPRSGTAQMPWHKNPLLAVFLIGLAVFASFIIECGVDRSTGMILRAAAALLCLARFGVLRLPKSSSVVGIIVAIALWLMVIGLWVAALLPAHEVSALHITYIGGFALLILAIGAQVTTSHGGIANFWKLNRAWCKFVCALVLASMLLRAQATIFPEYYLHALVFAATLLDLALIIWGAGVLRYVSSHSARK